MTPAQAIAGLSATRETELETVYPSIAAGSLGRFIGQVMHKPAAISNTPLRLVLVSLLGLAMIPLSLLAYFVGKLTGQFHVITNRRVFPRFIVGNRAVGDGVPVKEIASIDLTSQSGYDFYHVGDLNLKDASGAILLTIPAVPFPQRIRHLLLEMCSAQAQSAAALAQMEARIT